MLPMFPILTSKNTYKRGVNRHFQA